MSLPPERISIKRRRGEEPLDTLILERDRKRRFTDFIFRRLPNDSIDFAPKGLHQSLNAPKTNEVAKTEDPRLGVPSIKATTPGDEIRDFTKYKTAQKEQSRDSASSNTFPASKVMKSNSTDTSPIQRNVPNRRFHLTRDLSTTTKPHSFSGVRKKLSLRPPLPTFIERYQTAIKRKEVLDQEGPIDRILDFGNKECLARQAQEISDLDSLTPAKTQVPTFVSAKTTQIRSGTSIHDDPFTWDLESDNLANELAALAIQMDPDANLQQTTDSQSKSVNDTAEGASHPEPNFVKEDFVYETYVRMRLDNAIAANSEAKFGYLVIDEEDDDLWEQYIRDEDDEDDWDEEDEDSNAEENPRNDYPDDEVSSDDEFGRNLYRYRLNTSDDEQFGDD